MYGNWSCGDVVEVTLRIRSSGFKRNGRRIARRRSALGLPHGGANLHSGSLNPNSEHIRLDRCQRKQRVIVRTWAILRVTSHQEIKQLPLIKHAPRQRAGVVIRALSAALYLWSRAFAASSSSCARPTRRRCSSPGRGVRTRPAWRDPRVSGHCVSSRPQTLELR